MTEYMHRRQSSDKEKTVLVVISIIAALLLWAYVVTQVNPTIRHMIPNVPVQLLNTESLAARGLAVAGPTEYTINVTVEGRRSDIRKLEANQILAEVDLFGWSKGENYIPVTIRMPDSIRLADGKANRIKVVIEELVELNKPVTIILKGSLPDQTEAGEIVIQPDEIKVSGAKSAVESVQDLQAIIEASELGEEGARLQADLIPVNKDGIKVDTVHLSATFVDIDYELLRIKEVDLIVKLTGELSGGRQPQLTYPETIKIKGRKDVIKDITEIKTDSVDLTKHPEGGAVDLKLQLPDGILPIETYQKMQLIIKPVSQGTRSFQYSAEQVQLRGLPDEYSATPEPSTINISVSGPKEQVDELTAGQLQLFVDAANVKEGRQTLPLQIEAKRGGLSFKPDPSALVFNVGAAKNEQ